ILMPMARPIRKRLGSRIGRRLGLVRGPGAGRVVKLAVDRHRPPHSALTRATLRMLCAQHPPYPKPSRARVILLQFEDLVEQWERELVGRVRDRATSLIL